VGNWVKNLWELQKIVIISDETVARIYGDKVVSSIKEAGFEVSFTLCGSANKLRDAPQPSYSRTHTTHSPSGCLTKGNLCIQPCALL